MSHSFYNKEHRLGFVLSKSEWMNSLMYVPALLKI